MSSGLPVERRMETSAVDSPMPAMWDLRVAGASAACWGFAALLMNEASLGGAWGSVASSFLGALVFFTWYCTSPGVRGQRHRLPVESIRLSVMFVLIVCGCVGLRCCVERMIYVNHPIHQMVNSHEQVRCSVHIDGNPVVMKSGASLVTVRASECVNLRGQKAHHILLQATVGPAQRVVQGEELLVLGRLRSSDMRGAPIAGQLLTDTILQRAAPGLFAEWADRTRIAMRTVLVNSSHSAQAMLPGVSLGDKSAMTRSDTQAFRAAALSHILVISGFHTGIVTAVASALLPGRGFLRAGVSVLIVVLICGITGGSPSVIRASLMSVSCVLARLVGWGSNGGVGLSLAVFIMLLHNPWNAVDVGFCLSVAATAGLLWPAQKSRRWIRSICCKHKGLGRGFRQFLEVTSVAFWAQVSIMPIAVLAGIPLAPWGILANIVVSPVVGLVCIGGMLLAILSPVSPFLAEGIAWIVDPLAQWVFFVAYRCLDLPYSTVAMTGADLLGMVGMLSLAFLWYRWKKAASPRIGVRHTGHMTDLNTHDRLYGEQIVQQ